MPWEIRPARAYRHQHRAPDWPPGRLQALAPLVGLGGLAHLLVPDRSDAGGGPAREQGNQVVFVEDADHRAAEVRGQTAQRAPPVRRERRGRRGRRAVLRSGRRSRLLVRRANCGGSHRRNAHHGWPGRHTDAWRTIGACVRVGLTCLPSCACRLAPTGKRDHRWTFTLLLARLRSQRVAAERVRDVGDRALAAHAVAGLVERRRDHGDAELAGRHRDEPAADAALAGQAGREQPLAGVVVEARRSPSPRARSGTCSRVDRPACR